MLGVWGLWVHMDGLSYLGLGIEKVASDVEDAGVGDG